MGMGVESGPGFFDAAQDMDMPKFISNLEKTISKNEGKKPEQQMDVLRYIAEGLRAQQRELAVTPADPREAEQKVVEKNCSKFGSRS